MTDLVRLIVWAVVDLFRSRAAIEAEILTLRQQIIVLRRTAPKKQSFGAIDRLVFVGLYRLFPRVLDALRLLGPRPSTNGTVRGFRVYWCKSAPKGTHRILSESFCFRWLIRSKGGVPIGADRIPPDS
jgi:hypothetical protein